MKKVWIGMSLALALMIVGVGVGLLLGEIEPKQPHVKVIKEPKQETQEKVNGVIAIPEEYKEISNIIRDYELPDDGITDAPTESSAASLVFYENGYHFDKYTKRLIGREYMPEDGPEEPTEGQYLGVIMGHIGDINHDASILPGGDSGYIIDNIKHKLGRLYEIRTYAENYEPIKKWVEETLGYLEESKKVMETDDVEGMELYATACENIEGFDKVIDTHAIEQSE